MARINPGGGIAGAAIGQALLNRTATDPIVYSQDIQGGLSYTTNRLRIPARKLQPGMIVYEAPEATPNVGNYYRFTYTNGATTPVDLVLQADGTFELEGGGAYTPLTDDITLAASWEEIQFDVDSITVSSGNNDPLPRSGGTTGTTPANPHEGDLYINSVTHALWYYVGGSTNMWVNSQGITEGTGDTRYVSFVADQSARTDAQVDRARRNLDINLDQRDDTTAITSPVLSTEFTSLFWRTDASDGENRYTLYFRVVGARTADFDIGERVFVTLTSENRTETDALANAQFIGTVQHISSGTDRNDDPIGNITVLVDAGAGRTYLDGLATLNVIPRTDATWDWWKREDGYDGVIVVENNGNIVNQSIEVFEDRVRPTFTEYDAATTSGDFDTAPTRTLSHIGFNEAYNGPAGLTLRDDEGNEVLWNPTVLQPLRLSTTGGSVILSSDIAGPDPQATVRGVIGAGTVDPEDVALTVSSGNVLVNSDISATGATPAEMLASRQAAVREAIGAHGDARLNADRYALSTGNIEEWDELVAAGSDFIPTTYRAGVNSVRQSIITTTTAPTTGQVRVTPSTGYQASPATSGRLTLQYPDSTFINEVIAEGVRQTDSSNTNGNGVRIYGHTLGFPVGAIFEVSAATVASPTNTIEMDLLCEITDAGRQTLRTTAQSFTFTATQTGANQGIDIEEEPLTVESVTRNGTPLSFVSPQTSDPTVVVVSDVLTQGDVVIVNYTVSRFSGFTPSNPTAINGQQALYAILDEFAEVNDINGIAVTPYVNGRHYVGNDLVSFAGQIYRRVASGNDTIGPEFNPSVLRSAWALESNLTSELRTEPDVFTSVEGGLQVQVQATTNSNTFIFSGYDSTPQAMTARSRLLSDIFGFPVNHGSIPAGSPEAIIAESVRITTNITPGTDSIVVRDNPTATPPVNITLDSLLPTTTQFAIRLNGLGTSTGILGTGTGRNVTFARDPETRLFNTLRTHLSSDNSGRQGLTKEFSTDNNGLDTVITLGIDETIARTNQLPDLTNQGSSTIENRRPGNTMVDFEVRANSLGQTQFNKEGRAATGALMAVAADGQRVTYVPSNTNRLANLTPLDDDFDIAAQRYYTRDSWRGAVATERTFNTERSVANTTAFPLVSSDQGSPNAALSTHLSSQMITELNALNNRTTGAAVTYALGTTYGIRPLIDTGTAQDRHTIWQKVYRNPNSSGPFMVSVDYGFQFAGYTTRTSGIFTQVAAVNVRRDSDSPIQNITLTEWVSRVNALLQQSTITTASTTVNNPFAGQYTLSISNVSDRQVTLVVTSTFTGAITGNDQYNIQFVTALPNPSTQAPVAATTNLVIVQSGHSVATGTLTPTIWLDYIEYNENYMGDGSTATFTVMHTIVNQSQVIVRVDNVLQTLGTDYVVSVPGNSITFRESDGQGGFRDRNIADGITVNIIYNSSTDLANGQYLLFQPTGVDLNGDIESARWLNDGIGLNPSGSIGTYERGLIAFEITEYNTTSVNENRVNGNVNHVSNDDTGIRRILTRNPISGDRVTGTGDIGAFIAAEHDRYILIDGNHYNPTDPFPDTSGVYLHILNIDEDNGSYIEVDMDHWISISAAGNIVYRPEGVTFDREIVNDYNLFRLNFVGGGDVTKEGTGPQTVRRTTNFLNLEVDGLPQPAINWNRNRSERHGFGINSFTRSLTDATGTETLRLDAYTRDEADDNNQRAIARIHSEGITHDVAAGLSSRVTENGIGIRPGVGNHLFELSRGTETRDLPADDEGRTNDFDLISNLDNDILDSVQGVGRPTQPFVRAQVANHQQVSDFPCTQTFTVTQAQVDAFTGDMMPFDFVLNTTSGGIRSIVSATRNNVALASTDYETNDLPIFRVTTALDVGDTIAVMYRSAAALNEGAITEGFLGGVMSITNRVNPNNANMMQGVITTNSVRSAGGLVGTLGIGDTIALNTSGNNFDGSTSLELSVEELLPDRRTYIVRELTQTEIDRYYDPQGTSGGLIFRDRQVPTISGASAITNTITIRDVQVNRTTLESDTSRLRDLQILTPDRNYILEIVDDDGQYYHLRIVNNAGISGFSGNILVFLNTIALDTNESRWFPSTPDLSNFTGARIGQQAFFYVEGPSTQPIDLYYHLTPRDGDSNRLRQDWELGNYEVDISTAYSVDNRVFTSATLPVARHAFPIAGGYELGYFSNRLTLAGLERYEPVRSPVTGMQVLNFSNHATNPTVFYRGFYRTDLSIPVYMIRQVIPEFDPDPTDDDTSTEVQTLWGGWDGNIFDAQSAANYVVPSSMTFPTGDRERGEFFILTDSVIQGTVTREPGLYQRNQRNNGWTLISFGPMLPSATTINE